MAQIDEDVDRLKAWIDKQHGQVPDNQVRLRDALLRLSANDILHLFLYMQLLSRPIHLPAVLEGTDEL